MLGSFLAATAGLTQVPKTQYCYICNVTLLHVAQVQFAQERYAVADDQLGPIAEEYENHTHSFHNPGQESPAPRIKSYMQDVAQEVISSSSSCLHCKMQGACLLPLTELTMPTSIICYALMHCKGCLAQQQLHAALGRTQPTHSGLSSLSPG